MLLVAGLAKKVFLGDQLAEYVNPVYQAADAGQAVSVVEAWQATLGFTFQIYFDFSGYTDMALGLALLFGIVLPQNFDVPYRSASLQDFWRRWHMTLSRFLRDYLYIALGGNRQGPRGPGRRALRHHDPGRPLARGRPDLRRLGGGARLRIVRRACSGAGPVSRCRGLLGWVLTFVFVMLTWVLFRAATFEGAMRIYEGLLGFGPMGAGFKWRAIAMAAAVALIGPTAWAFVHRVPPRPWIAACSPSFS